MIVILCASLSTCLALCFANLLRLNFVVFELVSCAVGVLEHVVDGIRSSECVIQGHRIVRELQLLLACVDFLRPQVLLVR